MLKHQTTETVRLNAREESKEFITSAEVLRRVPVCKRTLADWMKRGIIPHIRLPGTRRVLFDWSAVEAALRRHQRGGN